MAFLWNVVRGVAAGVVALGVFLGVARDGCDEQAACTSFLGNATPDWPYPLAALVAVVAGAASFALTTALAWFWRAYAAERSDVT